MTEPPAEKKPMSNLAQRVIFGAIGAVILFGCIWYSAWSFAVFFALVQAKMLLEFYRMMRKAGYAPATWIGIGISFLLFLIVGFPFERHGFNGEFGAGYAYSVTMGWKTSSQAGYYFVLVSALSLVGLLLREMVVWPRYKNPFGNVGVALLGLFYVSLPMSLLVVIASLTGSYDYRRILALLLLVWAADIGAYAAGKTFGKHKLAPNISPGKTWEGWIGGTILTVAMGWVLGYLLPDMPLVHRLVVAGVVAVFGVLGDLAESMLKRSVDVKDSGRILPGHGGLLDRFDAFLFILPVLVLLQMLFGS
ncbi:phosphatidate cytidylyltransferase [Hymenobacter sp. BT491]|uniref:phosphatidate cytidylyltransferase n=1 Tax=Hymenobacter sp. BT491 TaxID=2766779 RepID=UPI0016535325|nr:phosphatidate cytidylyltransferase [Hymenobacter sp. BT491]MBC6991653.1 phosphatidate cytidylyltransferase [Hymenobacter sp. BT491]